MRCAGEMSERKTTLTPLAARFYSRALAFASVNTRDYTVLDGLIISLKKAGRPKSAAVYQSYRAAISGPVAKR